MQVLQFAAVKDIKDLHVISYYMLHFYDNDFEIYFGLGQAINKLILRDEK